MSFPSRSAKPRSSAKPVTDVRTQPRRRAKPVTEVHAQARSTGRRAKSMEGATLVIHGADGKVIRDYGAITINGNHVPFIDVYAAEPMTRIDIIKRGLPTKAVNDLVVWMKYPTEWLLPTLGIAPATLNRKTRKAERLSSEDSARVLGLARLVGQVQTMVLASGAAPEDFNAAEWVAQWLQRPLPALGGRQPGELMDTTEGQNFVSDLLAQAQSGAYA